MKIRLFITGRHYHLHEPLPDELTLPNQATVDDALTELAKYLPDDQEFPPSCLLAVSGKHLGTLGDHPAAELQHNDELTILAPVAGG